MNSQKRSAILTLIACLAAVAVYASFTTDKESKIDATQTPTVIASPTPLVTPSPTPEAEGKTTEELLEEMGRANLVIDDARAPDWLISTHRWLRRHAEPDAPYWLFQPNVERIVPAHPGEDRECVMTPEYMRIRDGLKDFMVQRVGNYYRYEAIISNPNSDTMSNLESDLSKFRLYLATSEYHDVGWQRATVELLAFKLGLSVDQIELTVPPKTLTESEEWVEGTVFQP